MSAPPSPARSSSLRIFLVEDHPDTRACMEQYLKKLGHKVRTAPTMQAALADIAPENCEVLICDVGLPDGDGWTLLRIARERKIPPDTYAVAISGFGTKSDFAASRAAGFRHHVLKPFSPEVIHQMLREAALELKK